eukprot:TRINITY_DN8249_c0_g1_i1.p1 TRINITY_DN8249_c0_g1~~TRINITY_DN8249_c0_g1_i1.p1  ORF type:complete len:805 (+),score=104.09 TRINITY_DN8249_c0_g1_i1:198-2417(+)
MVLTDLTNDQPRFDLFIGGSGSVADWVGDDKAAPRLVDLDQYIRHDSQIMWEDVADFWLYYNSMFRGETYSIPLDGDIHFLYYRSDILDRFDLSPPQTWDELVDIATLLYSLPDSERDWNGDGTPDFASCISNAQEASAWWWAFTVVAPYVQYNGTKQGIFFNTTTFRPIIDTPAFRIAATILFRLKKLGPPFDVTQGGSRRLILDGRCVFMLDWGDMSTLPKETPYSDVIKPIHTPGSVTVQVDGEMLPCNPTLCPHAKPQPSGKLINFAPYAANGGWSGMISSKIPEKRQRESYKFLSWMSSPNISLSDVLNGKTGFQPYRKSHLDPEKWRKANFSETAIPGIINGLKAAINSPNVVLDLRIRGAILYQQSMEIPLENYYKEIFTLDEFIAAVNTSWKDLTSKYLIANQTNMYRASLGLEPIDFDLEVGFAAGGRTAVIAVAGVTIFLIFVMMIVTAYWRNEAILRRYSPNFILLMMLSAIITLTGIIVWMAYPSIETCTTALTLCLLGFPLLLSNLFARTARVWWIQRRSKKLKTAIMSDFQLLSFSLVVLLLSAALIIVWCVIDIPSPTMMRKESSPYIFVTICHSERYGSKLFVGSFSLVGAILAVGCILTWNTKDFKYINESQYLAASLYNLATVVIIVIAVVFAISDLVVVHMFVAFSGIFACLSVVCIIVLPKFYAIYFNTTDNSQECEEASAQETTTDPDNVHVLDLRHSEHFGTQVHRTSLGLKVEVIF